MNRNSTGLSFSLRRTSRSIFLLVAIAAPAAVKNVLVAGATAAAVDLSIDLEEAPSLNASPGADAVNKAAAADPFIRTSFVLEHGKIVSSYVRDGVDPQIPWQAWSTTKSWVSLLTGVMLHDGSLASLNETLGEIFPDETLWAGLSDGDDDAAFRRAVTVRELLTMSSGLVSPPSESLEADMAAAFDGGSAGGGSLADSLVFPAIGTRGEFSYLGISNIMSYLIVEKTGKTPRQYLAEKVLPALGIEDSDINWWQNAEGVEYAYHGIELTPHQMAKFGQLYLARGITGPDGNALVPAEWIDASNSAMLEFSAELLPGITLDAAYGYLFWSGEGAKMFSNPNVGDNSVWCALGAGGQDICIDASLGRVSVQQRDFNPVSPTEGSGIMASVAMDSTLSFDVAVVEEEKDAGGEEEGKEEIGAAGDTTSDSVGRWVNRKFVLSVAATTCIILVGSWP